jgi:hypothetical protein
MGQSNYTKTRLCTSSCTNICTAVQSPDIGKFKKFNGRADAPTGEIYNHTDGRELWIIDWRPLLPPPNAKPVKQNSDTSQYMLCVWLGREDAIKVSI